MANKNKTVQQEDLQEIKMSFIDKYKKPFVATCVALLVIVAAVSAWNWYSSKTNLEDHEQLFKSEALFRSGQYDLALKGDTLGTKGLIELSKGSSDAANLAKLYAGLSLAKQANWEEAVKYLEAFSTGSDQTVSVQALRALANCYANLKQTDKAVATFKKAASKADGNSLGAVSLIEAAQLLEAEGNKAEARSLYEQVKKEHPEMAGQVEKYLIRTAE